MQRVFVLLPAVAIGSLLWAQEPPAPDSLSLHDAVLAAIRNNKSLAAAGAAQNAAASRITEARSGYLPKVNYAESWTRSDNPVFVFSSLLTQHQFGPDNFQIGPLNRPDFLNNFQSTVSADQTIYDAGQTKRAVRSAEISRDITSEDKRLSETEIIAASVRAYTDAMLAADRLNAANQAVKSAEADLGRAETVRAAGMATDADVLSIRVHLAAMEEERIRRSADLDVARAALNDAIGLPLDAAHTLSTTLTRAKVTLDAIADYEKSAIASRPEARESKLASNLAETRAADARGSLLPQVSLHTAFEADRQRFYDRGGANWLASVQLRWNVFNGFSDKARIAESDSLLKSSQATEDRTASAIKLQVRRAYADLRAAEQRIEAAKATVADAEESLRITQNRYEAGFNNVTDLLRAETAVLEARTRHLAAIHDQRIAATMLEFAAGRLTAESEVLN
ncbi:MAG: TolC family protein [Acidobacteriota bacterium]|nr:TolC family protein [Acidobacteriota bacterium]